MTRTALGTLIGLALGFALAFGSFGDMLIVALLGALGYGVAKIVSGELDLIPYLSGRRNQR
jgi:ABC-type sulfate transport system permease component